MKTTYVFDNNQFEKIKLKLISNKKIVDYFFNRNKLYRWEVGTNKFLEINGLIDISFVREMLIPPDQAKKEVNLKNIEYLVRRTTLGEYFFNEINEPGIAYRVTGEYVKNRVKLFDEYHLVFNTKIEATVPFGFKNVYYGNTYDYLETKRKEYESF